MLTLSYSFNWQKFNNKMNEKRGQEYQSIGPEYVTGQTNNHIEILICYSLMKHFPNDHKRYSSHLQVSMLHQVALIKLYLKFMRALKTTI